MNAAFEIRELVGLFRAGLVAPRPVAERARIARREPDAHDPWETIEAALFASIVAGVVDDAVPVPLRPLPKCGTARPYVGP